jgi:hypothetical protein
MPEIDANRNVPAGEEASRLHAARKDGVLWRKWGPYI